MKGQKAMTKGALLGELATATEMKKADINKVLNSLTEIGTEEVKKSGKFVLLHACAWSRLAPSAAVKGGGTRGWCLGRVGEGLRPKHPAKTFSWRPSSCPNSKAKSKAISWAMGADPPKNATGTKRGLGSTTTSCASQLHDSFGLLMYIRLSLWLLLDTLGGLLCKQKKDESRNCAAERNADVTCDVMYVFRMCFLIFGNPLWCI